MLLYEKLKMCCYMLYYCNILVKRYNIVPNIILFYMLAVQTNWEHWSFCFYKMEFYILVTRRNRVKIK